MTWGYGYRDLAIVIYASAATFPVALLVLRYAKSALAAGHYLAANIMLQTILFAADPAIGSVVLISLAAGVALLGTIGSRLWLALIISRCLYVAANSPEELASATAAVAAFMSAVVFLIVQLSEMSRARSSQRAQSKEKVSSQQTAILE